MLLTSRTPHGMYVRIGAHALVLTRLEHDGLTNWGITYLWRHQVRAGIQVGRPWSWGAFRSGTLLSLHLGLAALVWETCPTKGGT